MPYTFLEEIAAADVAFTAWGGSREELFCAAAEALLATMVDEPSAVEPCQEQAIRLTEGQLDLLLFAFLNELIFFKDARCLLLRVGSLQIREQEGDFCLEAVMRGEKIDPLRHHLLVDVKAATLHRLSVAYDDGAWQGTVVLDV